MKRPTFERWIRRECCAIAQTDSFSLVKLAALAQSQRKGPGDTVSRRRLAAALQLYALSNGCSQRLNNHVWDKKLLEKYVRVERAIGARDIQRLALRGTPMLSLPSEYRTLMTAFYENYYSPEISAEKKRALREQARELQLKTGTTSTDIARATGIAVTNVVAFLKNGEVSRISIEGIEDMLAFLRKQQSGQSE